MFKENQPQAEYVLKERKFNRQSLIIVTTVDYPNWHEDKIDWKNETNIVDKVRGDLALKMLDEARKKDYQTLVVDSGSSPSFSLKIKDLTNHTFIKNKSSISLDRQYGFNKASQINSAQYICWIEPEKVSFVSDCIEQSIQPILNNDSDIVIPKREKSTFINSYPDYQYHFESQSNRLWNSMLRKFGILDNYKEDFDVWFGPRIFKNLPEITELFLNRYKYQNAFCSKQNLFNVYKPEGYSNATFFPIIEALFYKYRVSSVEVPYTHPTIQTKIELTNPIFMDKRKKQQSEIIRTCADFCRMLAGTQSHTHSVTE